MTHLRIHLFYLALLGFLAYQYWTKTQALTEAVSSVEQFDKLLRANDLATSWGLKMELNNYDHIFKAYRNEYTIALSEKVKNTTSVSDKISQWLDSQREGYIQLAGGFDKNNPDILVKHLETTPSSQFFTQNKISEIRDSLTHFQNLIENVSDSKSLKELHEQYFILKLLQDTHYWEKLRNLTAAEALVQLSALQNKMTLDKMSFLFRTLYSVTFEDIKFDAFHVAIAPQKAVLFEGETFKADIYLAQFTSNPGPNVSIFVNNKELSVKGGVAHFENMEQTFGKKNVRAIVHIKNFWTGQISTTVGEFEYEVLPKCSRDCK